MVDEIEQSPNSRARCCRCKARIENGEKRFKERYQVRTYFSTRYYCYKCGEKKVIQEITDLDEEIQDKKRLIN